MPSVVAPDQEWIDPIRDGWMGQRIAECLGISAPYSRGDLCDFFETQLQLYDAWRAEADVTPPEPLPAATSNPQLFPRTKITDQMLGVIRAGIRTNTPNAVIRAEIKARFGVEISASHMSHTARRLKERDTL